MPTIPDTRQSTRGELSWLVASSLVLLFALLGRVYNAFVYTPMADFDAPGHMLNAMALQRGELPPPGSWLGFHPPLYHAASALLWRALPESVPVHVSMRLLSMAAGFGALWIVWRYLRRRGSRADAAVVVALAAGAPVFAIATSMLGNETACALFSTAVLARLGSIPEPRGGLLRHAGATGLLGALAALSKSTGWLAVGIAGLAYLLRLRSRPGAALQAAALVGVIPLLLAAPFYVRVVAASGGSPLSVVSGAALSPDLALIMSKQPPGERHLRDYLSFPRAALSDPRFSAPGMLESVPGMLYASTWSDAHWHFVWRTGHAPAATAVVSTAGLLPTTLALLGSFLLLRRRRFEDLLALLFAALLLASLLRYAWVIPRYSALKTSYLLPALLPGALALQAALAALPRGSRVALRAVLLAIGLAGSALITYGWWWRW